MSTLKVYSSTRTPRTPTRSLGPSTTLPTTEHTLLLPTSSAYGSKSRKPRKDGAPFEWYEQASASRIGPSMAWTWTRSKLPETSSNLHPELLDRRPRSSNHYHRKQRAK